MHFGVNLVGRVLSQTKPQSQPANTELFGIKEAETEEILGFALVLHHSNGQ